MKKRVQEGLVSCFGHCGGMRPDELCRGQKKTARSVSYVSSDEWFSILFGSTGTQAALLSVTGTSFCSWKTFLYTGSVKYDTRCRLRSYLYPPVVQYHK